MEKAIRETVKNYYDVFFGIGALYERFAKSHELTSTSLFVLYVIHEYPDQCTQRFICEKLFYPKQTVNTVLNLFEKKGLIKREIASSDKRNKYIMLTDPGKDYAERILGSMLTLEEKAFLNMGEAKRVGMLEGERSFLEQLTKLFSEEVR